MNSFNSAVVALKNLDPDTFSELVEKLNKSEIQELAKLLNIQSATLHMKGSWIEEFKADLVNSDSEVIQSSITCERGYKGLLHQHYDQNSLQFLAVTCLDVNFRNDFDEDSFQPGSMIFEACGTPADSADYSFECKYESRLLRADEINDENFDESEYDIEELDSPVTLSGTSITPTSVDLYLEGNASISFDVSDPSLELLWFLFSGLFISSGKSIADLKDHHYEIKEFMSDNFDIAFN